MTRLESPVCNLDRSTRPYTHLTQPASRVERSILFGFNFEVLSAGENGFQPHLNGIQQTVPISTPKLPFSGEEAVPFRGGIGVEWARLNKVGTFRQGSSLDNSVSAELHFSRVMGLS